MRGWRQMPLSRSFADRIYYRLCCFLLFFAAAAASFNGYYDKQHLIDLDEYGQIQGKHTFASMMDGTANRPFIFRQMIPTLANWLNRRVSPATQDRLFNTRNNNGMLMRERFWSAPLALDRTYFLRYWIVYYLVFFFALLATYSMYGLGKAVGFSASIAALTAVAFILIMPFFFDQAAFLYDYPEMALFFLAVWAACKGNWLWLILVAALGTWNKESFLFFLLTLYPLLRSHASRRTAWLQFSFPGVVSLAIFLAFHLLFRNNPGSNAEIHFAAQLAYFPQLFRYLPLVKTYGILLPRTENVLWIALLVWTVWLGWRLLPEAFRRHGLWAAAINFPLFVIACYPAELRNLSMMYPTLLLLIGSLIRQGVSLQLHPAGQEALEVMTRQTQRTKAISLAQTSAEKG